jgi:hypothetical protein
MDDTDTHFSPDELEIMEYLREEDLIFAMAHQEPDEEEDCYRPMKEPMKVFRVEVTKLVRLSGIVTVIADTAKDAQQKAHRESHREDAEEYEYSSDAEIVETIDTQKVGGTEKC